MSDTQHDAARREAAMPCCGAKPPQFEGQVIFSPRYANPQKWAAHVRARCTYCKHHFRFEGLTKGVFGGDTPASVSYQGYDALLPIDTLRYAGAQSAIDKADPWEADASQPPADGEVAAMIARLEARCSHGTIDGCAGCISDRADAAALLRRLAPRQSIVSGGQTITPEGSIKGSGPETIAPQQQATPLQPSFDDD